jgi:hypothetical protein
VIHVHRYLYIAGIVTLLLILGVAAVAVLTALEYGMLAFWIMIMTY